MSVSSLYINNQRPGTDSLHSSSSSSILINLRPATAAARAIMERAGMISKPGDKYLPNVNGNHLCLRTTLVYITLEFRFCVEVQDVIGIAPTLCFWSSNFNLDGSSCCLASTCFLTAGRVMVKPASFSSVRESSVIPIPMKSN